MIWHFFQNFPWVPSVSEFLNNCDLQCSFRVAVAYRDVFLSKSILKDSGNYPLLCGFFAFVVNFFLLLRSFCFLFFLLYLSMHVEVFTSVIHFCVSWILFTLSFLNVESLFEQRSWFESKQHRLEGDSSAPLTGGRAKTSTRGLKAREGNYLWWTLRSCLLWESRWWCAAGAPQASVFLLWGITGLRVAYVGCQATRTALVCGLFMFFCKV